MNHKMEFQQQKHKMQKIKNYGKIRNKTMCVYVARNASGEIKNTTTRTDSKFHSANKTGEYCNTHLSGISADSDGFKVYSKNESSSLSCVLYCDGFCISHNFNGVCSTVEIHLSCTKD